MQLRLPSPLLIFATTAATVFGIVSAARGLIDADAYWHLAAGRLVLAHGVMSTDPFSYTWAGQPWVMHEWLGEVLMYGLVSVTGVAAATFIFGAVSVSGVLLVAWTLRRSGTPMLPLALATGLALYVYASYATIRPQAISWLLLGVLLSGLLMARPMNRWLPWLAVPLFVLWANVHGLYVVGLGVLGVYVLFTMTGRTPMSPRRWEMLALLVACFAASCITPAGPAGLLYPLRYVDAGDWGLSHIAEWQSPDFHNPANLSLLMMIAALIVFGTRATPGWLAVLAAGGVAGALLATRNVPIAGLLALPAMAHGFSERIALGVRPASEANERGRRILDLAAAVVVVVAAVLVVPRLPGVAGATVIPRTFPVAAVDELVRLDSGSRVFAEYHWGGYVIDRLFDRGARVFVDGRNDMYSEEILEDYVTVRNAEPGWPELIDRYGADAIILPPETRLIAAATEAGEWCEAHRDDVAVLLQRCDAAGD